MSAPLLDEAADTSTQLPSRSDSRRYCPSCCRAAAATAAEGRSLSSLHAEAAPALARNASADVTRKLLICTFPAAPLSTLSYRKGPGLARRPQGCPPTHDPLLPSNHGLRPVSCLPAPFPGRKKTRNRSRGGVRSRGPGAGAARLRARQSALIERAQRPMMPSGSWSVMSANPSAATAPPAHAHCLSRFPCAS